MLTSNQTLQQGRYRVIKPLGLNGIGSGYEAFDSKLESNVLLKEIPDNLSKGRNLATQTGSLGKNSLSDGAKALTLIKHESLLHVHDYFSEVDQHYLVAELLDGKNLGEMMEERKSPFALSEIKEWADQLLNALHCLHNQLPPVIHGKIRPQSLKLTPNGKAKLLTFDIAHRTNGMMNAAGRTKIFDQALMPFSPLEQIWESLDVVSQRMLLKNYNEKSQKILEQPADAQSDLFAFSATLYYLATAHLPVEAVTRSIDILEGKADPLPTPHQLNPAIPPEVSNVIMRALEIRREDRYGSAVIMRQVLRTAFVQVKEREAEAKNNLQIDSPKIDQKPEINQKLEIKHETEVDQEIDLLEIPFVSPPSGQPAGVAALEENLFIETEQKEQIDLIDQLLPETERETVEAEHESSKTETDLPEAEPETEPLEAEECAIIVEAEKHLPAEEKDEKENEAQVLNEKPAPVAVAAATATAPAAAASAPGAFTETSVKRFAAQDSAGESDKMFAQPEKENKLFKSIAAAALALIVVGGAAWAVWNFALAGGGGAGAVETRTAVSSNETAPKPAPTVETNASSPAAPSSESTTVSATETNAADPAAVSVTPVEKTVAPAAELPAQAVKPTPQIQPQAKKPAPVAAKTPETQKKAATEKKAVTLDDLIN